MIDYNSLGQALDTTWGRSSTVGSPSFSVKFTLHGNVLTALYGAVVNFGTEVELQQTKRKYSSESESAIKANLNSVKKKYKDLSGKALKVTEDCTDDSLEIVGMNPHNPKRTAFYRRKTVFCIGE